MIQNKLNSKQALISSGKGMPSLKEGKNGDITIRNISGRGLFLFYKYNGKWYSTRFNRSKPKYAEDKESVILPRGRNPRKPGEITLSNYNKIKLFKTDGIFEHVNIMKQTTVTISEAEMNALHTTEKTLVAAQGSNQVIIPTSIVLFVDRDGSTTQTSAAHLYIGINGGTTLGTDAWLYFKNFMRNESGDRIIYGSGNWVYEACQALTTGDNQPLTAKLSSAVASGSIDSCKVSIIYYVFDNS